ncbi:Dehydrogenase with different specificities [Planctomycetales bacterium 10988]|nr:Dehydrogenase with different specificities [Planctomycetales bacterium 10988]
MSPRNTPSYFILGATGGIGTALCQKLKQQGARLFLVSQNQEKLKAFAEELDSPFASLDARSIEEVQSAFQQATETIGPLNGVVNLVGSLMLKPAHLTTEEDWNDTIALNLTSAFATVRAAAKAMKDHPAGLSVVLMSTAASRIGIANHEAIAAAKAGVIGLAQSAAATYAGKGMRVNVVAPGLIRTPLTERIWKNEGAAQASLALHALDRLGEPDDVAEMIGWLLDPQHDWITGQVFGIDGGLATLKPNRKTTAKS